MLDISNNSGLAFDERLAVLEERTKPKPRTVYDRIKDWAGQKREAVSSEAVAA